MVEQGGGYVQHFQVPEGMTFEGYGWLLGLQEKKFLEIRKEFRILDTVVMEVPEVGCCDNKGFAGKVAIFVSLLSHRLRLCHEGLFMHLHCVLHSP